MVSAGNKYAFEPDYTIPPEQTLREVMESLGMSPAELAKRTDLTAQSLNRIFWQINWKSLPALLPDDISISPKTGVTLRA